MSSASTGRASALAGAASLAPLVLLCAGPPVLLGVRATSSGNGALLLHLLQTVLPAQLGTSLLVALGAVALGSVLALGGILAALVDFPGRVLLTRLLLLPLLVPAWCLATIYRETLGLGGALALAGVLGVSLAPLLQLLASVVLRDLPARYAELLEVVGRDRPRQLVRALLPLCLPGLSAAAVLGFLLAWGDLAAARILATPTLTVGLFDQWLGRQDPEAGAVFACLLLAASGPPAWLLWRLVTRRSWQDDARLQGARHTRRRWRGRWAALPWLLGAPQLLVGVVVPVCVLGAWAIQRLDRAGLGTLGWDLAHGVLLALGATLVAAALALPWLRHRVLEPAARLRAVAGGAAVLAFALPPSALALGWLALLPSGGEGPMAHLNATPLPLLLALGARHAVVFLVAGQAALLRRARRHGELLRVLGRTGPASSLRLLGPLAAGPLGAAAFFVFLEVLKDVSLSRVLQPFDFATVATHLFQQVQAGRLREAAVWSLCLAAAGLYPLFVIQRLVEARPGAPR